MADPEKTPKTPEAPKPPRKVTGQQVKDAKMAATSQPLSPDAKNQAEKIASGHNGAHEVAVNLARQRKLAELKETPEMKMKTVYLGLKNMLDFNSKMSDEDRAKALAEKKIGTLKYSNADDVTHTVTASFEATRTTEVKVILIVKPGGKIDLTYELGWKKSAKIVNNWSEAQEIISEARREFIRNYTRQVNESAEKIHNLPQNDRLKMITGATNEQLKEGNVLTISFATRELEEKVGAKNILPPNVRQIKVNGRVGYRSGLNGNFYTKRGEYVAIFNNDRVEIMKMMTNDEAAKAQQQMAAERLSIMGSLGMIESNDHKISIKKDSDGEKFVKMLVSRDVPKETALKELGYITETARDYGIDATILIALRRTGVIGGKYPHTEYDLHGRFLANAMELYNKRFSIMAKEKNQELPPARQGGKLTEAFLYYALPRLNLFTQQTNEHKAKFGKIFEAYGYSFNDQKAQKVETQIQPYKRQLSEVLQHYRGSNSPLNNLSLPNMDRLNSATVDGYSCSVGSRLPNKYCAKLVSALMGIQPPEAGSTSMYSRLLAGGGQQVSKENLKPGDVVFFTGTYGNNWSRMTHVALVVRVENGIPILRQQSGFTVKDTELQGYWIRHYAAAVRPAYKAGNQVSV